MPTRTVGFNVYLWSESSQNRFLCECLAAAVRRLYEEGVLKRFWYDRMGTRGPHLFILASVESSLSSKVDSHLCSIITSYLKDRPSAETLTMDQVRRIHDDMQGKVFCKPDLLESLAENNTFQSFEQEESQYPFSLIDEAQYGCDIWRSITNLFLWSLNCLDNRGPAALSQIASAFALLFSRICLENRSLAADYWKYHSETLLLGLDRAPLDEKTLALVLPKLIGEKNLALFKYYEEILAATYSTKELISSEHDFSQATRQVSDLLPDFKQYLSAASKQYPQQLPETAKIAIREILHTLFKQFGLRVPQHIPIVLFLWLTNLEENHRIERSTQS